MKSNNSTINPASGPAHYRPDIDGLRAIAVLAVIGFHASSTLIPGGFAGVDIFFVISGYLISGLIFKEIERGTFSFSEFYKRRIKRILPAYIVVSLFTLIVSSYLLIPNDYIFYTTSLAASWGFASNIFFSMLSWGYFGQRTEEFPLLHTWSLSVEEQFYFLFPILLIFLYRYFRKQMVPILLVSGLVFVGISEMKMREVGAYFLLPYRAHELIIGVLTFFAVRNRPLLPLILNNVLAFIGLSLILGSLFLLERSVSFPGVHSLYPCLGAALVIYAGSSDSIVTKTLRNPLLVFIGLLSYSLYLWHWPLFSFLRYRQIDITLLTGTAVIVTSFVLAFLTWKLVEMPIRENKGVKFSTALLHYYVAPAAVFLLVGGYSYFTEGVPQRFSNDLRQLISSYSFERDLTHACSIRSNEYQGVTLDYLSGHCAFGDLHKKKADVLLFGDSHAYHFKPFVERLTQNANLKGVYYVEGSCTATDLFNEAATGDQQPSTCEKRNADLLNMAGDFKYVVLASFWPYKDKEGVFKQDLEAVVKKIISSGATPVIFKDNPYFDSDLSQCILFKKRGWITSDKNCNIPTSFVSNTQVKMNAVIDLIKATYPSTIVIDPKIVMCNERECATYIENVALYKDRNHINSKASTLLAERYMAAKGNPLRSGTF
ncbi:MAG: acyltransferase family protein [Burkholderiaceae bacterium]